MRRAPRLHSLRLQPEHSQELRPFLAAGRSLMIYPRNEAHSELPEPEAGPPTPHIPDGHTISNGPMAAGQTTDSKVALVQTNLRTFGSLARVAFTTSGHASVENILKNCLARFAASMGLCEKVAQ